MNRRTLALLFALALTAAFGVWWRHFGGERAVLGPPPDELPEAPVIAAIGAEGAPVRLDPFVQIPEAITSLTHANDGSDRVYITGKDGQIWMVDPAAGPDAVPWVDLSELVGPSQGERGLLSIAFEPDYAVTRRFYSNFTDELGHTRIVRHVVDSPGTSYPGNVTHELVLLIEQPYGNHNGGQLQFGPDGMLYVGMGDGGAADDPHDNGERFDTLLGKLLRLDVRGQATYRIPPDNPFANLGGSVLPEMVARGLRNPWRFSFDPEGGAIWIADVGQNLWEEINRVDVAALPATNFGWDTTEGSACFEPATGCSTEGITLPVYVYGHDRGCSVTGGYVLRDPALPELTGAYVFSDFCSGRIETLTQRDGAWVATTLLETGENIASFGVDEDQHLYVLALDGRIWKVVPNR